MPHKLRKQLEGHIPQLSVRNALRKMDAPADSHIVRVTGHMEDMPGKSDFMLKHTGYDRGFHVSVRCDNTEQGRRTAERFNGAFGSGSEKPKLVHIGGGKLVYEYWPDELHYVLAPLRESWAKRDGRAIAQKNY